MFDQALRNAIHNRAIPKGVEAVLRDQTIDTDGPGTILRDFSTLLDFVGEDGLPTTGKYYQLPQAKLDELNQRMSRPLDHQLSRPQLRSFPQLQGLNLILRATGLGVGLGGPPKGRLAIRPEMLAAWRELNATERYFALLEYWLCDGSPTIIGERSGFAGDSFGMLTEFVWINNLLSSDDGEVNAYGVLGLMLLNLMELFGWLRLDYAKPKPGKAAKATTFERTPFGSAMLFAIVAWHRNRLVSDSPEAERPVSQLQPLFQPYFPEWQRTLDQPERPLREGTYTWRVSLGKVWRRIVAPAEMDLDELTAAILSAFDFDMDHLYCFELRDDRGRPLRIACPHEHDVEAYTDEVLLGDLPLPVGGTMTMEFDYGDSWYFDVKLETVGPPDRELSGAEVTAKHGKPPPQYDFGDEEEEFWDDDKDEKEGD
jgi:hypothetical protein